MEGHHTCHGRRYTSRRCRSTSPPRSSRTRRLSSDYNVLALAAPEIAAARAARPVRHGEGRRPARAAAAPAVLGVRSAREDGRIVGLSLLSKRIGPTTALLFDAEARRSHSVPRAARPPVRAGRRRPMKRGWWPAASASRRLPRSPRRCARGTSGRRSTTARAGPPSCSTSTRSSGVGCAHDGVGSLATEDGSRGGERGRVTVPLERDLHGAATTPALMIYACGPEPMLAAVAQARRWHTDGRRRSRSSA